MDYLISFSLFSSFYRSRFSCCSECSICSLRSVYRLIFFRTSLSSIAYRSAREALVSNELIVLLLSLNLSFRSSASAAMRLRYDCNTSSFFLCSCSLANDFLLSPSNSAPSLLISSMLSMLARLSSSNSFSISLYFCSVYFRFSAVRLNL